MLTGFLGNRIVTALQSLSICGLLILFAISSPKISCVPSRSACVNETHLLVVLNSFWLDFWPGCKAVFVVIVAMILLRALFAPPRFFLMRLSRASFTCCWV
ncbi:uncharacterized protein EKO05_0010021 [Ascochyta rabiei]|uniref:uncharacterized protein n=1 Tax=Didymella rabiei TaxID=5454 RepID=UPI0022071345|nr:uncharacterized protein EKO05_0010021 [Ascochyta rabiei]UPX19770.1 hypothetical protein EKO05_0010021 [Ascochyta rabiei]